MALPAWFWPPSGATARSVALAPYAGGLAVPDWITPTIWPFSTVNGRFSSGISLASGHLGLAGAAADSASGLWTVAWDGRYWHLPASGPVSASGVLPSGQVYVGCATPGGSACFLRSFGQVINSGSVQVGLWPIPARFLTSSGTVLGTLLAGSGIGTMNAGTGATGLIALPAALTTASCLAMNVGSPIGVAGWSSAPALSGAAAAMLDPADALGMLSVGSGFALLWRSLAVSGENWSQTQVLSGLANLNAVSWRPDGTQALATSVASGVLQVINYSVSVLSLTQTLPLTGACSVAITSDSSHALVAQSGQSQAATFTAVAGTWSSGAPVTGLPGIAAVSAFGASGAVATQTSGLSFLSFGSGGWAVTSSAALTFTPTVLTVDSFMQVYAAGSGALAVFSSGAAYLGSGALPGNAPTGIAVQEGRVVLTVPSDNRYYIYGETNVGSWTQQASGAIAMGPAVGLSLSAAVLFMMGSGATNMFDFTGLPYSLTPVRTGVAGQWNGSTWITTALGIGNQPSACAFDVSGDFRVATIENTIWSITSGGIGTSGTLQTYSGQTQITPLAPSALYASSSGMYVATSIPGVLMEIT